MAGVVFSKPAARRIAAVVRKVEGSSGSRGVGWWQYRGDNGSTLVLCKTTAEWAKGTTATLQIWSADFAADTGQTLQAKNYWTTVPAGASCGVIDGVLVVAECS